MTIVLKHWGKFREDFLFNIIRGHNYYLFLLLGSPPLLHEHLVILFQPHILIKLSKGKGQSKGILDSINVFELSEHPTHEVVPQLFNT